MKSIATTALCLAALALQPACADQMFRQSSSPAPVAQPTAPAGKASDELGLCFADSTTGKDRKELARWIFVAMSAHPSIRDLSIANELTRSDADKYMAKLVTQLLSDSCVAQARATVQTEGNEGVVKAFRALGEMAMREIMSNPDVLASIGSYVQYLDKQKIDKALGK